MRCCRRYQNGSRLHSRPGDFVVELDDATVHGEVRGNVLLLVDILLGVQDEVLFIICTPSSFGSLVFSSGFAYLRQTSLASSSNHPTFGHSPAVLWRKWYGLFSE